MRHFRMFMANGRKNYFRHSMTAHMDQKIQKVMDELGLEGYACFFILVEIVAQQCENEFKESVSIHRRVIANALRKRSDSVHLVVTKLALSGVLSYNYDGTNFQLSIPNLRKYIGQYEIKSSSNVPNKKKIKEKKTKENSLCFQGAGFLENCEPDSQQSSQDLTQRITFSELLEIWNHAAKQLNIKSCKAGTKIAEAIEKNSKQAFKEFPTVEDWERIVEAIRYNPFLVGANDRGWRASLEWLFQKSPSKNIKNYILLMDEWLEHNKQDDEAAAK